MGFFDRLFKREVQETKATQSAPVSQQEKNQFVPDDNWIEVPAYVPATEAEYELASVIATAIAAGDAPESQFVVKKIMKRNPEARKVAVISASIAAGAQPESQMIVKKIFKRK